MKNLHLQKIALDSLVENIVAELRSWQILNPFASLCPVFSFLPACILFN